MSRDPLAAGEDALVREIARRWAGASRRRGDLGIGDDAAWLRDLPRGAVASTDLLVEGVHFRLDWTDARSLGEKAAEVNLSDLAAMGAAPRAALMALAVPGGFHHRLPDLLAGVHRSLRRAGCALAGGDTTASDGPLVISLTVIGSPSPRGPMRRGGGRPGHRLVVTGRLGAAAAGLALLEGAADDPGGRAAERVLRAHRRPRARLAAGRALAAVASAGLDLSDGLAADLPRLCRASGVGARLEAARLPVDPAARRVLGPARALAGALSGGEDYELLVAIPPGKIGRLRPLARRLRLPLTEVGHLTAPEEGIHIAGAGGGLDALPAGFDHFLPGR